MTSPNNKNTTHETSTATAKSSSATQIARGVQEAKDAQADKAAQANKYAQSNKATQANKAAQEAKDAQANKAAQAPVESAANTAAVKANYAGSRPWYRNIKRGWLITAIIVLVIVLDQTLKIWVKTHFYMGQSQEITSWFYLHFIENNGMAFGLELTPKFFLTLFRIILSGGLLWYIVKLLKSQSVPLGYMVCLALITAGAMGNIIDCAFYGLIFDNPSAPEVATMFPDGGGYGTFMHGKVVDMLYFPLVSWYWPDWMPWIGGDRFEFFQPVFNLADAAISVGMIAILLFYRRVAFAPTTPRPEQ